MTEKALGFINRQLSTPAGADLTKMICYVSLYTDGIGLTEVLRVEMRNSKYKVTIMEGKPTEIDVTDTDGNVTTNVLED